MIRLGAILTVAAAAVAAWAGDTPDDRKLIQRAPAQRPAQEAPPAAAAPAKVPQPVAAPVSAEERAARIDANLALAKLDLILGRKALAAGKHEDAARKAQRVLALLRQLPPDVDVGEYELQAEGILALASKAGVNVEALLGDGGAQTQPIAGDAELDRRAEAAAQVARQYNGSARPEIDTRGDARALRERAVQRQKPDRYGYKPGREIVDVDSVVAQDEQRLQYQAALREAYKADEQRLLVEADEARVVPNGVVSYPNDWPERVQRRQKWADGVVARSPSWFDKDGREWYVAIYDIHDLIYVPPEVSPANVFSDDPLRDLLDRQALREHSFIFRGWPEDLEMGLPLLRYFGGVNTFGGRPGYFSLKS